MTAVAAEQFRAGIATQSPGVLTQPSRRGTSRPDPPSTGRGVRPQSRPPAAFDPRVPGRGLREVRACTAEVPHAAALRLTERGMAVIIVVALMLLVSAVVVIGLTAVRVTGPNYVPYGQTSAVGR